jgi:putative ABC transport system substrate-binding protein
MDRRRFLLTSLAGAVAWPLAAKAQPPARVYTLGILSASGPSAAYGAVFSSALRERGYQVGGNLQLEPRYAGGKVEALGDLAAELAQRKVDVILAFGAAESLAAAKATATIPIVFMSPSPVEIGLVHSLARPGGNVTGLSVDAGPAVSGKIIELLTTMTPGLSSVALLVHPDRPGLTIWQRAAGEAAQSLGVRPQMVPLRREADLESALASLASDRPGALLLPADPLIVVHLKRITDFAIQRRLPTATYVRSMVDQGCLLSYGPDFLDLTRRAVSYIDRVLKGTRPADLPVEQPAKFELVFNLATAKALGLTIPPSLLARADQVIE